MYLKPSLLSRMKDPEPQDPESIHQNTSLLTRITLEQDPPLPNLLYRMSSPTSLQGLPLRQTQDSIKMFSSNATPLLKNIERGRPRKRLYMSRYNRNLRKRLVMTEQDQMLLSDRLSPPSKVMMRRSQEPQREGQHSIPGSAPPALLCRMQMSSSPTESQCPKSLESMNQLLPGSLAERINVPRCQTVSPRPSSSLTHTLSTLRPRNALSLMSRTVQNSRTLSGRTSSQGEPSISMPCSADSSPRQMMTSRSKSSEISRSPMGLSSQPKLSRMEESGRLLGTEQSELSYLPSHIDCKNLPAMENTSSIYSPSPIPASMVVSSPSTKQSANGSVVSGTLNYQISRSSPISKLPTWTPSEYLLSQGLRKKMEGERVDVERIGRKTNLAINGTKESVIKRKRTAEDDTSATNVERHIGARTAELQSERPERFPKRPKYLQRSVWMDLDELHPFSPTAECTITDEPLPRPPPGEFDNTDAVTTISRHPHLFRIVTPVNVDRFEQLLETHPNRPFVESVCTSLREGFWPWACTQKEEYPTTWDFSDRPPKSEHEAEFLRSQRDIEIAAGRYSEGFGSELLPGMYSTPIHAVPKPRSAKLRLVNDHSAGPFSLNSMIAREDVVGAKMDSISDLTTALLRYRRSHPDKLLVMFKSDVSAAYRRLPLHPLWQIKQIVTIDGIRHVDRNTSFGGRGSCRDWTAFMGLVLWIAIFIKLLTDLFGYIDDGFSFDEEGRVLWYEPYGCYYPAKQTQLLHLWDEIGLPHEKSKQEYGPVLRIIGFLVDPNRMRITMDEEDRSRLIEHVIDFTATAPGGTRRTLREFQQLAGWVNWSFNVFPLLKPALSNIYAKMSGKSDSHAKVYVSKAVVRDLSWFVSHVRLSDGVYLFQDVDWDVEQADVIAYSDACLSGLGFYFRDTLEGFQCMVPHESPRDTIFYFEALAVVSVIEATTRLASVPAHLLIFSDNSNTVDIFYSLRSLPPYNDLLKFAVSLLIKYNISLRVVHIPGVDNVIADALSRFENTKAVAMCPSLKISLFQPPRIALGPQI